MDLLRPFRDGIQQLFSNSGEEESRRRFEAGLPLPVCEYYVSAESCEGGADLANADSCWNGMVALDARPFRGISLEGGRLEPLLFRSGDAERGECTGSSSLSLSRCELALTSGAISFRMPDHGQRFLAPGIQPLRRQSPLHLWHLAAQPDSLSFPSSSPLSE